MPVAHVELTSRQCRTAKLRCYKNIFSTQPMYRGVAKSTVEPGRESDHPVAERHFYYVVTHLCVLRVFSVPSRRVRFRFTPFTSTRSTPLGYTRNRRAIKEWENSRRRNVRCTFTNPLWICMLFGGARTSA